MASDKQFTFPFGQVVHSVKQLAGSPAIAFVLGVYASAVHARWMDKTGKQIIAALAVASEPEIFWRGENALETIDKIIMPEGVGLLKLPNSGLNGPSGRALDELYLKPLNLSRSQTWLCDILPETRLNLNQKKAICEHYNPLIDKFSLPRVTIPEFNENELNSTSRRIEILEEFFQSEASTLILLGDLPIIYFLNQVSDMKFSGLREMEEITGEYGHPIDIKLEGHVCQVIPLCHPRQASRLGFSNNKWFTKHQYWITNKQRLIYSNE